MPGFDALAPDQKAVLQLLLKQGKTYDDIAGLLRLDRANVRERALDALDALGADLPGVGDLDSAHQDELADHLLLQQTAEERSATRGFLETSKPGRAWARGVSEELRPIGGTALPKVPEEPADVVEPVPARDERTVAGERDQRSSRLGGVILLAAVAGLIALAIVFVVRGGKDDASTASNGDTAGQSTAADGATGTTGVGAAGFPQQQINLKPPSGSSSKALGFALIAEGGLALQAEGLPKSDMYAVWIYTSKSKAVPLGFAAYDAETKRVAGAITTLPAETKGLRNILLTKQPDKELTTPGQIVLRGPIRQGSGGS